MGNIKTFLCKSGVVLGATLLVSAAHAQSIEPPGGGGPSGGPGGGPTAVPEPSTWLLLGAGVAGIVLTAKVKRKKKSD